MTVSLPIGRRATKCFVPGASAIYLFNEGSGTSLLDHSGNGYHGTLGAGAEAPAWGPTGLTFDGGDSVTADGSALDAPPGLTIQVAATAMTSGTQRYVSRATTSAASGGAGFFLLKSDSGIVFVIYNAGGNRVLTPYAALTLEEPTLVTGVYTGTTAIAYAGAAATEAIACVGHAAAPAQSLTFGKDSFTGTNYLDGTIYAALLYPFALTPAQIATNHAAIKAMLAPRGVTLA